MSTITARPPAPDPIARAAAAAVDAARHANEHAGNAARHARDGDDQRAWEHRRYASFWRVVSRAHAESTNRARLERTVAWVADEALS